MPRATRQRSALAAAFLIGCCSPAQAQDFIARSGWQLELFGEDVAILRSALTSPSIGRAGQLLLSCEGYERRIRLTLPERAHDLPRNVTTGRALIRQPASPPSLAGAIVAPFSIDRERVLSFARAPRDRADAALRLAGLLRSRPARLDILLHYGSGPVTMRRSVSYALALGFDGRDDAAFAGFIAACARDRDATEN